MVDGKTMERPCFWIYEGSIHLIDQRELPLEVKIITAATIDEQVECIKTLAVRGAPAIGSFAAWSLSLAVERGEELESSYSKLLGSRPTAVDLRNCLDEVKASFTEGGAISASGMAQDIYNRTIEACRMIGEHGSKLIPDNARILTHCNAGALAAVDWGTALSPIRIKKRSGGDPFIWVSETRPLLQGSRLTAWELSQEGIDHSIIVDSASGYLMREGKVDLVITGADRVCANGDFANKIGTYEKAVLAKELGIPFYVAFPRTTIDPLCPNGSSIPIEERDPSEVHGMMGKRSSPEVSEAFNPAFDMTPGDLVTSYITEEGVFSRDELVDKYIKKAPP
jgi:translation initiation factor eIF-2B subunit alpha/methylthioribose-1-phosphate isomerase